jgi:hypothetical protein
MTDKTTKPSDAKKRGEIAHPGMLGDGTEEQNLNQRGDPAARVEKADVAAAFRKQRPAK